MLCGATTRAILLAVVTMAAILTSAIAARQADAAMPHAARPDTVTARAQPITNVCGANGCARVQTQRVVKHPNAGNFIPGRN
jgi:hypothetical protein